MINAGAPFHIPFAQACELAAGIAALPMGHEMNAACSVRTAAAASYALQTGIPAPALRIVGNFLPQLSAQGLRQAFHGKAPMLHRTAPFSEASFMARAFAYQSAAIHSAREVEIEGVRLSRGLHTGRHALIIRENGSPYKWPIFEPYAGAQFYNHHALGVRTPHPLTGRVQTMPIEPAFDKTQPVSMATWRARQTYIGAVPTVTTIGGPFTIDVMNMDAASVARLAEQLSMPQASRLALARRIGELSSLERLHLVRTFFCLSEGCGQLVMGEISSSESRFFDEYSDALAVSSPRMRLSCTRPNASSSLPIYKKSWMFSGRFRLPRTGCSPPTTHHPPPISPPQRRRPPSPARPRPSPGRYANPA
jgi:hypothetical protein